jgi:hypothetical protein
LNSSEKKKVPKKAHVKSKKDFDAPYEVEEVFKMEIVSLGRVKLSI